MKTCTDEFNGFLAASNSLSIVFIECKIDASGDDDVRREISKIDWISIVWDDDDDDVDLWDKWSMSLDELNGNKPVSRQVE